VTVYSLLLVGLATFTAFMTPAYVSNRYPLDALAAEWHVAHFGINTFAERLENVTLDIGGDVGVSVFINMIQSRMVFWSSGERVEPMGMDPELMAIYSGDNSGFSGMTRPESTR